ncbi:SIMPL domain-containing protein [Arcticibacter sp. MXS-1]|uniref:SIMPL domain-containing protein n=1 Tax=Arcticibacter sp. MXS-1 TaxID=3341726 RepID=UPI0035A972CD
MKKYVIIALLSIFCYSAYSQTIDTRRKIEVNGSAEAEVTPDIIYFSVSLREYFKDNNIKKKVEIDDLEKQLLAAVTNAGVPKENFTVNNISSYASSLQKKKNPEFLISKQYRIKVQDLNRFNQIMEALDTKAVQYTNVDSYDYSKIESLKKDLKIKALQAAKDKATYLATALNDGVGKALEVQEINNEYYPQAIYRANASFSKLAEASADNSSAEIDFKKIKLNYQMRVVFELK